MANNPYVNKVVYGGNTLIDLSSDTVTADKLYAGYTAHDAAGAPVIGTASGSVMLTQDENGYIIIPPTEIQSLVFRTKTGTTGGTNSTTLSITDIPSNPVMFYLQFNDFSITKTGGTSSATAGPAVMCCMYDGANSKILAVRGISTYSSSTVYGRLSSYDASFTHSYSGTTLTITVSGGSTFPSSANYTFIYVC